MLAVLFSERLTKRLHAGLTADDDDVDSVSPRTLRQAADRLAQFTSEQAAGTVTNCNFHSAIELLCA